jgi:uncharacterized membrane protein
VPLQPPLNEHNLPWMGTFHPIVVHFVIAMGLVAFVFDLIGSFGRRPALFEVSFWNLLFATVAIVAAILFDQVEAGLANPYGASRDLPNLHSTLGRRDYGRQVQWSYLLVGVLLVAVLGLHGTLGAELAGVNRPVRCRLVSLDVLHGLSIPSFRLRQDVVPGSVIDYRLTPSREGRYRLRDSLFSGACFASNQTDVVVESPEAFEQWRQAARRSPLAPSPNAAVELWSQRQERGNRGWATVPPAPPPLVNVLWLPPGVGLEVREPLSRIRCSPNRRRCCRW